MSKILAIIILMVACTACDDNPEKKPVEAVLLKGSVGFGSLKSGTVTVYDYSACKKGGELAKGDLKDSNVFQYHVRDSGANLPVLVELSNINHIDDWSDTNVTSPDDKLYGVLVLKPSDAEKNMVLSFWTHLATALAEQKCTIDPSKAVDHITESNTLFSTMLTFDVHEDKPLQIKKLVAPPFTLREVAGVRYGIANAAVSSYTLNIGTSSLSFATAAYDDLAFDGKLDGVSLRGPLTLATTKLNTATYRNELALNMDAIIRHLKNMPASINVSLLDGLVQTFRDATGADFFGSEKPTLLADAAPPPLISSRAYGCSVVSTNRQTGCPDCKTIYTFKATIELDVNDLYSTSIVAVTDANGAQITLDNSEIPWRSGMKTVMNVQFEDTYENNKRVGVRPISLGITNDYGKTRNATTSNVGMDSCTMGPVNVIGPAPLPLPPFPGAIILPGG